MQQKCFHRFFLFYPFISFLLFSVVCFCFTFVLAWWWYWKTALWGLSGKRDFVSNVISKVQIKMYIIWGGFAIVFVFSPASLALKFVLEGILSIKVRVKRKPIFTLITLTLHSVVRACHWLQIFSRACHHALIFPRFASVTHFPPLAASFWLPWTPLTVMTKRTSLSYSRYFSEGVSCICIVFWLI